MIILKLLGGEFDIGTTANNCSNASLVRVLNAGARAKANVAYSNGVVYANVTISNTESVIISKSPTLS